MNSRVRLKRTAVQLLPAPTRKALARQRDRLVARGAERARRERAAGQRRELLAADATVREVTIDDVTYLGRIVDRFTAREAAAHNLNLVLAAVEKAGIEYFLVPSSTVNRHIVGVRRDDRRDLLAALRELYRDTPLCAAPATAVGVPEGTAMYLDGALPADLKASGTIRFGEVLLGPRGQVLADLSFGCDVEFWKDGARFLEQENVTRRSYRIKMQFPAEVVADSLVSPRRNEVSEVLPTEAQRPTTVPVQGRRVRTFEDFAKPRLSTIDFPIDVVYTWVDGDDPEMRAKRNLHRGLSAVDIGAKEVGASRYTSHDELKYSLRSLQMYGEFVRHVYIVTDGQTPSWLDINARGVTVVDHKEIFADPDALPVFNSHAIGTQLHHIEGLSEHYLYFNDDVLLGRPVDPRLFFHSNGIARLPFSPAQFGLGAPHALDPAPNSAGKNVRKLLLDSHGRFITNKFKHTPHPQRRSVMRELEERFAEEIDRTSRSRFRSTDDIAMGATLHHHFAYLTGRAVPGEFNYRYVDIGRPDAEERLVELETTRGFDFFCLNDVDVPEESRERVQVRLHAFLESYFPFPSTFERTSS
ncbi:MULTISPECIES: stealth family protein [unclassified Streptomyces]|uniref:stealth family protein n=1 Tax=unclassified Streptomyces TaxID=2593676 RepID=UPI0022B742D5|nr:MULTISPECIES: stealth family protein [unclassified Streptomyces]MCZ7415954.1 stealth family protein [Streptomyces sp. WMMC897]MCZ7434237.1 stealth family protein [Streptomyces sp. WMMC1477]